MCCIQPFCRRQPLDGYSALHLDKQLLHAKRTAELPQVHCLRCVRRCTVAPPDATVLPRRPVLRIGCSLDRCAERRRSGGGGCGDGGGGGLERCHCPSSFSPLFFLMEELRSEIDARSRIFFPRLPPLPSPSLRALRSLLLGNPIAWRRSCCCCYCLFFAETLAVNSVLLSHQVTVAL